MSFVLNGEKEDAGRDGSGGRWETGLVERGGFAVVFFSIKGAAWPMALLLGAALMRLRLR